MPLRRLTGLEIEKLQAEHKELVATIEELVGILSDPGKVTALVKDELSEIRDRYADTRLTEIVDAEGDLTIEDLIAEERMVITVSHQGYIKRTSTDLYRRQRRGGRGARDMRTKDEDWVEQLFVGTTHDYILIFTDKGKAYWLKVYELPQAGRASRGRPVVNLLTLEPGEHIQSMIPVDEFSEDRYLVMCTRKGQIVKNQLSLYGNPRKTGIKAIKIADGDELINVQLTNGQQEIFIATNNGMAVRFNESDVRSMGRDTGGVRGINLADDDRVVSMLALRPDSSILTVCEHGHGKRTKAEDYRLTKRGGKGVINIKASQRNGKVIASRDVTDNDELIMISERGLTIRLQVSDLRMLSRNTQGVRVIDLGEGDRLVSVARIDEEKEAQVEGGANPEEPKDE